MLYKILSDKTDTIYIYINRYTIIEYKKPFKDKQMTRDLQDSFFQDYNQDDDIKPQQLSGDESAERSVLVSDVAGAKKANFLLTVTTIMKTVIGAGILSLPLTIKNLGYGLSLLAFALIISADQFTCVLLLKVKNLSRHSNYASIIYHIFKNKGLQIMCSAFILINNLGICVVELTIFKETLNEIIVDYWPSVKHDFYCQPWFIVLVLALLEVPFTLVKKIEKLKFMAFLGVAGISVFVVVLTIIFFTEITERNWKCSKQYKLIGDSPLAMASVIPNIMLALSYQMNFFPIFKGLKQSRDSKMSKASIAGILGCTVFYIVVGNMGACLYGDKVQANFLTNFDKDQIKGYQFILVNAGFLISVFFSFPVMFFGARNNFIAIIKNSILLYRGTRDEGYKAPMHDTIQQISSYVQPKQKNLQSSRNRATLYFYIYTGVLYAIAVGTAIAVDDIESVFNLVGAIASNAIAFVFPTLFYIVLIRGKNKQKNINFYISMVIFIIAIPLGIFAIVANLTYDKENS